ncbi:MAG: hypothetical protein SGARI_003145 [Bacillariaceae sp.]
MNGIAMENFSKEHRQQRQAAPPSDNNNNHLTGGDNFFTIAVATCFVTSIQLLIGAVLGRTLLFCLNRTIATRQIVATHWSPLSLLHACGSLATNFGFMYGKASVVQVIKLLEPFETLILSQLFFREEGKCSVSLVASMAMVIAGALSLLLTMKKQSKASAPPQAVVAALASGLLLSSRNVLQRKHQSHHLQQKQQSTTEEMSDLLPTKQQTPPSPSRNVSLSKLEKSILQFTQLSFFSGLFVGAGYVILSTVAMNGKIITEQAMMESSYREDPNFQLFLWHPLYNVFSMITLGFCSALTHSLLNAGKRVFAICMAMIWFHERLNDPSTLLGLLTVALGGSSKAMRKK